MAVLIIPLFFFMQLLFLCCATDQCILLQNCTHQLEVLINRTRDSNDTTSMIPLCLNFIRTGSDLIKCETNAVSTCGLTGTEEEYATYQSKKVSALKQCRQECPNMNDVQICHGYINYGLVQTSGYADFCSNFKKVLETCVNTKLSTCSFRHQLFEAGLSNDGRRIVQTICQSGCLTLNTTLSSIQLCNKQYALTTDDHRLSDCSFYKEYIDCINKDSPCEQFRSVAEYYHPGIVKSRDRCEPSNASTRATTSVMGTASKEIFLVSKNQETSTIHLEERPTESSTTSVKGLDTVQPSSAVRISLSTPNSTSYFMTTTSYVSTIKDLGKPSATTKKGHPGKEHSSINSDGSVVIPHILLYVVVCLTGLHTTAYRCL